ncbi:glycosyl transferase family 1 [Acetobacter cibinongensis]|uniref:Glycosyl transferase n=1 Tax=Acetobacter cibinongensis TaxID=146475 RepID=A0A0D6N0B3_9PROT|nr:glycosyltransferase family 4 protein [Acetobacter cibinongensis]GAN59437.1 glycosyl transferase [Acetobacter cibinongensis]GBQ12380.1 glycosyltransferase [Acetobacter cibinongensis NRIC 0482]GEL59422.1 glycosyl transferase family 1 [Acetobacter cibinongensis]
MKYLFIHQNFPGQYLHLVRHLVQQGGHEIVFISEDNANVIQGVRRVRYRLPRPVAEGAHPGVRELDSGLMRADEVAKAAATLKNLGFVPDIILGHHGWGELLNIQDVYPDVPVIGYFEFYYHTEPGYDVNFDPEFPMDPALVPLVRAKNSINLLALTNPGHGQTPTLFQKGAYPAWAQDKITVVREGVDLTLCRPNPQSHKKDFVLGDVRIKPTQKLVTYVSRDLEPYRGFHVFMRALPRVLEEQPDAHVIIVGSDGVSYGAKLATGCWRQILLQELGDTIDLSRVHFVGKVAYEDFLALLQRSDAHVYLTYPFVASWSLREAMATGCAIVGSDTAPVQELLTHGETALLVPFHQPERIAEGILRLLTDKVLAKKLRKAVRAEAEQSLCMDAYLAEYEALIAKIIDSHKPQVTRALDAVQTEATPSAPVKARKPRRTVPASSGVRKKAAAVAKPATPVVKKAKAGARTTVAKPKRTRRT